VSFIKKLFLSKAERDYLLDREQASHDYVCVKSRLNKKLKVFVDQELPLLLQTGYLSDIAELRNIADFRNAPAALVAQLAEQGFAVSSTAENTERTESPRRDLNARPKVYETFALPAELLGLLVSFPVSHLLLGFAQFRNTAVYGYLKVLS
jgi:hypothetical protein